jgi:hypothetical protein
MAIHRNQLPYPNRTKRSSLGLSWVCALSLLTGSAMAASQLNPQNPVDYSATELAALTSLQELIPKERFDIEVIIFKHRDTRHALLATMQTSADIDADPVERLNQDPPTQLTKLQDPREPLLLDTPRRLPSQFYGLLPSPLISESPTPFGPANSDHCWALRIDDLEANNTLLPTGEAQTSPLSPWESMLIDGGLENAANGTESKSNESLLLEAPPSLNQTDAPGLDLLGNMAHNRNTRTSDRDPTLGLTDDSRNALDQELQGDDLMALDQSIGETTALTSPEQIGLVPQSQAQVITTPYLALISELTRFQKHLRDSEFQALPTDALSLTSQAQQLERSGTFQVLDHFAWQQPVPPRNQPQHIYLRIGDTLQGTLAITLGRYLHTAATLWLQPDADLTLVTGENELEATQSADAKQVYALMNQSRRMRSGELHYFDHPLFGMLVQINPVEHDEATKAQFEAFKAQLEQSAP